MPFQEPFDLPISAERAWDPGVLALALMGSRAGGNPTSYSDVDLVRFTSEAAALQPADGTYYWQSRLVVLSTVSLESGEQWFTDPQKAVETIAGLRSAQALRDPSGVFAQLQARAHAFQWTDALQRRANAWASRQMVGWIEEVHKGLGGLETGDVGRLLNARFGLSWGLTRLMSVQRGVLQSGDNALLPSMQAAMGQDTHWSQLCGQAFGVAGSSTLPEQVQAGLRLYAETSRLLADVLTAEDAPLVRRAVALIQSGLLPA